MTPTPVMSLDLFDFGRGRAGDVLESLFSLVLGLAVLALVVIAIVLLVRRLRTDGGSAAAVPAPTTTRDDSAPLAALDLRFARGEIDEDDYRRRRAVLRGEAPTTSPVE